MASSVTRREVRVKLVTIILLIDAPSANGTSCSVPMLISISIGAVDPSLRESATAPLPIVRCPNPMVCISYNDGLLVLVRMVALAIGDLGELSAIGIWLWWPGTGTSLRRVVVVAFMEKLGESGVAVAATAAAAGNWKLGDDGLEFRDGFGKSSSC